MLALLLSAALAGDGWVLRGPDQDLPGAVDVPLLRSPDEPRPHVLAAIGEARMLAIVDLAGGPTRVGWGPVYEAKLKTHKVRTPSGWHTRVTIPELTIGDAVLHDVRAEVSGTDDLVIGVSALHGLEVALLPSEGVVRWAPAGSGLVQDVGEPVTWTPQPLGRWWQHGREQFGDGATARVPVDGGVVHFRTDLDDSAVPEGGVLPDWAAVEASVDDRPNDPDPAWRGAVGIDALSRFDLAIAPDDRTLSRREAEDPAWGDPDELAAALEVLPDRKSKALWKAGMVEDALEQSVEAAETGDCMAWLILGMRRLRAGEPGALEALEEGMGLWTAWSSLDRETRDRMRAGKPVDADAGSVQPASCDQSVGRWLLARLALGEDPVRVAEDAAAYDVPYDTWVPLAEGVAWLRAGDPERAEPPLRTALQRGGGDEVRRALVPVLVARGRPEQARAMLDTVEDHPLLTQWTAWRLGLADRPELDRAALEEARVRTAGADWTEAGLAALDGTDLPRRWAARSPARWLPRVLSADPHERNAGFTALQERFPELWTPPREDHLPDG